MRSDYKSARAEVMLGIIIFFMKQIEIIIFFCLFFTGCPAKQKKNVDTLYIRFFSWEEYNQPHIITCTNFEYELPYTEYCISDQIKINRFLNNIDELQETSDTDFSVGCKIFFMRDGKVVKTACLNSHYVLINGKTYFCTKDLIDHINSMMYDGALVDTQKKYIYGKYGDEYIHGREALLSKFETYLAKKIPDPIKKSGDIRIVVYCKSDKMGKTTRVDPRVYRVNNKLSDGEKKYIEGLITKFFTRKVKWKPDYTRMKSDWIKIMYKYKGN